MDTNQNRGGISIELEHIFPIIKKWLYSEKEIFLREIVSNACDAITKLRRLNSLGEADVDLTDAKIKVILDDELSTITVVDTGIGMSEDEVRKYICQIALSGALDFIQKYEGTDNDAQQNGIIGHFGLGFYSAFMVSDTVDVITKSYTGAPAVKWTCTDDGNYEMEPGYELDGELIGEFGTAVVMHVNDEGREFLRAAKLREVLDKYCAFMPEEIYFDDGTEHECKKDKQDEEAGECTCPVCKPVNDVNPLWQKNPSDCKDEEYKEFYQKVFHDWKEPLFHIHLKADYPLNFKGILYFPRIGSEFDSLEGQVKLYYNQVFVADNIKEVIPEYLLMLKGVLDCPELPLNVSRSYLQNSGYVAKISAHITKKVADKLNSMFAGDRENFESIWRDLKTFVEYGCLRDRKFYDRVSKSVLFELTDGTYKTVEEYLESAKERHSNKIYYANDVVGQSKYVKMFRDAGIDVVVLDRVIDTQFISMLEQVLSEKKDGEDAQTVSFIRIDSEIADVLKDDGEITEIPELSELFKKAAGEQIRIVFDRFKDASTPAILNISEEARRMNDMMKLYKMAGNMPMEETLILNLSSPLIVKLTDALNEGKDDLAGKIAHQIYMLASLSQRSLSAEELLEFLDDSYALLGLL